MTSLAEFAKSIGRGRVENWTCKFVSVMTTSPTATIQGIKVAFDDDQTLIGTCFLPAGDHSSRFKDVPDGAPLTLAKGNVEMITLDATQFSDCEFKR